MGDRRRIGLQSALLVSWGVIGLSFLTALLMWRFSLPGVGALLMAVAATGLAGRLWGLYALRGLEAEAIPEREVLSAGQSVTVRYTVRNNKALPLIWAEVLQDIPPRECLVPDAGFARHAYSPEEAERTGRKEAYVRRLAFLPGYGEISWDTEWSGVRRGVYRPHKLGVRSGDGFGLAQSAGELTGLSGRVLVIWPRIVPVRTEPFLRNVWSGSTGRLGWAEDPNVMRGERAYQPGDPWKRIDWRAAARTDELMVRQYETIRPLSVLFILDAASLEDEEEGISLLASVIYALSGEGTDCGLALPAAGERGPLLLRPEDGMAASMFALSELDAETAAPLFDDGAIHAAASEAGQIWIVTESASRMRCPALAERLSGAGARLLCARREAGLLSEGCCTFGELRRKEADG